MSRHFARTAMPRWSFSLHSTVSSECFQPDHVTSANLIPSDTKLMGKAFVSDIVSLAPELAFDKHGRRAIFYLLTPTSTRHFIHASLSSLVESAQKSKELGTSKKDMDVRRKELLSYANEGLVKLVEEKGEEMVRDPGAGLVVQEIMLYAQGGKF